MPTDRLIGAPSLLHSDLVVNVAGGADVETLRGVTGAGPVGAGASFPFYRLFSLCVFVSAQEGSLLKQIVPQLSRMAIFGVPGLNALQFKATKTAARAFNEKSRSRMTSREWRLLEHGTLKPVSSCHLLSCTPFRGKSASLRWPNSFPSFPCLTYFQRTAAYWLMCRM